MVRRGEQVTKIRQLVSEKELVGCLEFAIIDDLSRPGALDDSLKGVTYAIHLASPVGVAVCHCSPLSTLRIVLTLNQTNDYMQDVVNPAVYGTVQLLKSALTVESMEKVVVTSSIAAIIPWKLIRSADISMKTFSGTLVLRPVETTFF